MPEAFSEFIDDIEDLISSQDITPKERYASRKNVSVRSRKRDAKSESEPVEKVILESVVPGTQTIYVKTWGCAHNNSDSEYMAGLLAAHGYKLTEDKWQAQLWLLNSCTVKSPSEDHFKNEVELGQSRGVHVVVAGCVPQGAPRSSYLARLSVVGVHQIDRIVEIVEETLKGTYGRDIGTSLPELLWKLVEVIPEGCRLRLGMTNPPYILEHLAEVAKIMHHPRVYKFLHVPVQSGSDQVLADMKREYSRADFEHVVEFLRTHVPGMTIATDIICGFPTETERDFEDTLRLCDKYRFPSLFINQFFPRPGTPAAKMTRVPGQEVKKRTKQLSELFRSYEPYGHKVGETQEVLVTDVSHDKNYFVAHNEYYEQVLVPKEDKYMGKMVTVKITDATKFSMMGQPIDKPKMAGLTAPLKKGEVSGVCQKSETNTSIPIPIVVLMFAVFLRLIWMFL
ncbi:threonylcarbamoyladenosine tRNA methylthiotransferase-like isoform X2 [Ostrinia furnacalis]|uniref:threonylcarbamoyladenosine tRNA methylthiotransferase-like isoform X2 n=1 Tax=Ostrinia furnacalis TaxID=93504 RepID=UPI001040AFCA|nr:threonylcarbamoyladenosine tRNA methylthiotransferase-like isoform X2 [Ostrinia furnacalis]